MEQRQNYLEPINLQETPFLKNGKNGEKTIIFKNTPIYKFDLQNVDHCNFVKNILENPNILPLIQNFVIKLFSEGYQFAKLLYFPEELIHKRKYSYKYFRGRNNVYMKMDPILIIDVENYIIKVKDSKNNIQAESNTSKNIVGAIHQCACKNLIDALSIEENQEIELSENSSSIENLLLKILQEAFRKGFEKFAEINSIKFNTKHKIQENLN